MLTSNARVLIADGDPEIRKRLYSALLDLDVFSDSVSDGKAAIGFLKERPYAMVVVDLALEKMDAPSVLAAIEALPLPRPMVVATTGSDGRPTIDSDLVQIVLRKPFEVDEIAEIIRSCVRASRKARAARPTAEVGAAAVAPARP